MIDKSRCDCGTNSESTWEAPKKYLLREKWAMRIVWAMPRWVIKWAVVRATAHGTMGQWGMTEPGSITAFQVMDRWAAKP